MAPAPRLAPGPHNMNQRNSSTTWALLLGCLCFVAGGTLAVSKYIDPAFGEYAGAIGRAMANGGTLGLFGLVLIAVYTSTTSSGANSSKESGETNKSSGADQSLVLEQLAGDMAQVRAQLETLQKAQQAAPAAPAKSESDQLNSDDRLFRLAAGIDQLGARVDSRLKTQHGTTMDAIDGLGREVQALLERMAELETNTNGGFERISSSLAYAATTECGTTDTTGCDAQAPESGEAAASGFEWATSCGLPDGDCTSDEAAQHELAGVDGGAVEQGLWDEATGGDCPQYTLESCATAEQTTADCTTTECATTGDWQTQTDSAQAWTVDEAVVSEDFVGTIECGSTTESGCTTNGQTSSECATDDTDGDPYAATPEPEIELVEGFQSSDDDFEVSVELEPETAQQDETGGLGILDSIEAPQAALPQTSEPDATSAKLATLMELMGDPAVRKALEALQRGQ